MAEGRLGSTLLLLAAFVLVLGACDGGDTTETTLDATSTTQATTQRASTTTTTVRTRTSTSTTTISATTSTTSTDQTGTPPETPPVTVGGLLGVVGCSNTDQAVEGYIEVSDVDLLTPGGLGGGSITPWGNPADQDYSTYWSFYDDRRPAEGYAGTWVQLCIRTSEHKGAFDDDEMTWVTHIVEQVHARDPGIPVWVSPINFYEDGVVCEAVGVDGPAIAAETSDWAATALGDVLRGPDLGPLTQSDLSVRDNCHPGGSGRLLLGSQLAAFFD
jgi:hypothetical protein